MAKKRNIFGRHSVHEYEELYKDDQPGHKEGVGTLGAFFVVFGLACLIGAIVILLMIL